MTTLTGEDCDKVTTLFRGPSSPRPAWPGFSGRGALAVSSTANGTTSASDPGASRQRPPVPTGARAADGNSLRGDRRSAPTKISDEAMKRLSAIIAEGVVEQQGVERVLRSLKTKSPPQSEWEKAAGVLFDDFFDADEENYFDIFHGS